MLKNIRACHQSNLCFLHHFPDIPHRLLYRVLYKFFDSKICFTSHKIIQHHNLNHNLNLQDSVVTALPMLYLYLNDHNMILSMNFPNFDVVDPVN
jgi:hypothetical protein